MSESRLVMSPVCQLPKRAMVALEQASVDELLEPGAFTAMGHLPAGGVLADALDYANHLVESVGAEDLFTAQRDGTLAGAKLMAADALFLSQVFGLIDVAATHGVTPDEDAQSDEEKVDLAGLVETARSRFVERAGSWRGELGRRSARFRVQEGEGGVLWPSHVVPVDERIGTPDPETDPDAFVLFGALPLLAPFLVLEEDCFVAPRLE